MTDLTIILPFTLDVHTLWLQLVDFSQLPLKLGRGRGCRVIDTAVEWEQLLMTCREKDISRRDAPHRSLRI